MLGAKLMLSVKRDCFITNEREFQNEFLEKITEKIKFSENLKH